MCGHSGALERGDGAPFEPLAQLGDALRGVGAATVLIKAEELDVTQAAKGSRRWCQWALTVRVGVRVRIELEGWWRSVCGRWGGVGYV